MTPNCRPLRPLTILILAAALPLAPAEAQEASAPAEATPPVEVAAPPAPPRPEPVEVTAPGGPAAREPRPARDAARSSPAAERRASPQTEGSRGDGGSNRESASAPSTGSAPEASLPSAAAPLDIDPFAPESVTNSPTSSARAQGSQAAAVAPSPEVQQPTNPVMWPWLLAAGLGLAAVLWLSLRRRRSRGQPVAVVRHEEPEIVQTSPAEPESLKAAPISEPVAAAEAPVAAAVAASAGIERPWVELVVRPRRAGVREADACVEFELEVANSGSVAAEQVRVSAWMLAAGSPQEGEAQRLLIEPPAGAAFPEVTIDAGDGKRIEAAVALRKEHFRDAVLPVVVADARYRLPDGGEGRTSACFAVGVPSGEDLAHFDAHNPSGLHEGVEARLRGQPHKS